ncbi:hypothetical protein OF83DRAFT_1167182 [Amylostereum chailletii]|nr:hypothetical protein OF83DRAFT_1167182 [Amylostereum chailletii]
MAAVAHLPSFSPFDSSRRSYPDPHAMAHWNRPPPYSSDIWSHHQTPSWSTTTTYAARSAPTNYHSNDIPTHSFASSTSSSTSLAAYDARSLVSSPDLVGPLDVKYSPAANEDDLFYPVIDGEFHTPSPARRSASPTVKIEHDDRSSSSIVFDTALTMSPPPSSLHQADAQVPLRATQASKEMRLLMGVFRLDPFAVQGAVAPSAEAGPLEEPGRLIEFQLPLEDESLSSSSTEHSPASSVAPESNWGMVQSKHSARSLRSLPSDTSLEASPHYSIPLPTLFPENYASGHQSPFGASSGGHASSTRSIGDTHTAQSRFCRR